MMVVIGVDESTPFLQQYIGNNREPVPTSYSIGKKENS